MDLPERLQKVIPHLECPDCRSDLENQQTSLKCLSCQKVYQIIDGKIYFNDPIQSEDHLDSFKTKLKKKLGKLYYTVGIDIIAPEFPFNSLKTVQEYCFGKDRIILDAGSGNYRLHEDIICIDGVPYEEVDLVCDLYKLPFKENSIDFVLSKNVLEHLIDPYETLRQFHRVTKEGSFNLHVLPFLYPFHASPHDYTRFTHQSIKTLFKGFDAQKTFSTSGPVSVMLCVLIELLSTLFCFNNEKLRSFVYLFFCLLFFPFKYLDFFFIKKDKYLSCAQILAFVIKKKSLDP